MGGLAFSPWIVAGVSIDAAGDSQPVYGPLYKFFAVYFMACYTWALIHLFRKFLRAKGFARAQLHYLLLGATLTVVGGATPNLLVPLLFGSSRFNLAGPYFALFLVGFAAHSIVRHRLMDIRVVIGRWAAYAVGWAIVAGLLVGGGVFLTPVLTATVAVVLGLISGLFFVLVAPSLKRVADRYLYRPAY